MQSIKTSTKSLWAFVTFLSVTFGGVVSQTAVAQTALRDLERKIESVLPKPEEVRWLDIPWETNPMRARQLAAQKAKPLFIWIMDGHVLGCT